MEVMINGSTETGDFNTVNELLAKYDILPQNVVVELNGNILPKEQYESTKLKEGDTVELIQFVAGG